MSAISNLLPTPPNNFSTILNGSIAANGLSIVLQSTSGLPAEGIGTMFKKDSTGAVVANSIEKVHWTSVNGSTLNLTDTGDRGLSGSANGAQTHDSGDYFEVWVDEQYYNGLKSALAVSHNDDGTIKNNAIETANIQDNAVTTSKITNANVTTEKIAANAVTYDKISTLDKARVTKSAVQAINDGSLTSITWNQETTDTNNLHDNAVNNTRLTCKTAGTYLVTALLAFYGNATGVRGVYLMKNGTTHFGIQHTPPMPATSASRVSVAAQIELAVGDYVEVQGYQTCGDVLNILNTDSYLAMTLVP